MTLSPDKTRVSLYLELDLKLEIEALAKKEKRSLSNFIEVLCQKALEEKV